MPPRNRAGFSFGDDKYDTILIDTTKYIYEYNTISPYAWSRARIALVDALGCAIETLHYSAECVLLLSLEVAGTITPNNFRLPGIVY